MTPTHLAALFLLGVLAGSLACALLCYVVERNDRWGQP